MGQQLGCVLACLIVAALAVGPEFVGRRGFAYEAHAIGHLKTIHTAQVLFREDDRDGDEVFNYGSLQQLSDQALVDGVLGSGTKNGYVFRAQPQPQTSELLWWATANPERPGATGDRYFAINQHGVVCYRIDRPFDPGEAQRLEPDGENPDYAPLWR